jgi:hypothetical protein
VISNHYTSILLGFAACASLLTIQRYRLNKSNYILVIVLILLSFLVRFEVASVLYLLFSIYSFIYYKKLFKRALIILAISLSIQGVNAYLLSKDDVLSAIFTFEHEVQDRESVNFKDMESKEWYKFKAMGRFIVDDSSFTIQDYTNYLEHKNKFNYVFDNPDFISIYRMKVTDLIDQLFEFKGYLFIIITLSLISFYSQIKRSKNIRLTLIKFLAINLSLIAIPLGLSLFLLCSPAIVFSIYFAAGFMSLLRLIIERELGEKQLLILLISLVIINFFYIKLHVTSQNQENKLAESLRREMLSSAANNETIVFTYPANFSYYQSKLFQNNLSDYTPHYYLDLGLINHMKPFKGHNQHFFGESYFSLKNRMLFCANNPDIVLFSTLEYNEFLLAYISIMYQDTFQFVEIPNTNIEGELNMYHLYYAY